MSTVVLYCWCHSDSASVLLYFALVNLCGILNKLDQIRILLKDVFAVTEVNLTARLRILKYKSKGTLL